MFGWGGSKYKEGLLFFYPELVSDMELFPTLSAISDLVLLFCGKIRTMYELGEVKTESVSSGKIRLTRFCLNYSMKMDIAGRKNTGV